MSCTSSGSGRFRKRTMRSCTTNAATNAMLTTTSVTTRRARSWRRCSTRVVSSPCRRRRGCRAMACRLGDALVLAVASVGGDRARRLDLGHAVVVVGAILARHGVLELAQTVAQRAAHFGQTLRPEDQQRGREDEQDLPELETEGHAA